MVIVQLLFLFKLDAFTKWNWVWNHIFPLIKLYGIRYLPFGLHSLIGNINYFKMHRWLKVKLNPSVGKHSALACVFRRKKNIKISTNENPPWLPFCWTIGLCTSNEIRRGKFPFNYHADESDDFTVDFSIPITNRSTVGDHALHCLFAFCAI